MTSEEAHGNPRPAPPGDEPGGEQRAAEHHAEQPRGTEQPRGEHPRAEEHHAEERHGVEHDRQAAANVVGPWRRRSRAVAYANPWIEVFHDEVDRPDGGPGIYGVVHFRNAAVGVVAVADDGRLLLVGQHRYTLDEYSWELPEGGVPFDEALEAGARRELREETGYEAEEWHQLSRLSISNSVTDEVGALFLATGLRPGTASPDPTEDLALRWATLDEVLAEIAEGRIHDLLTIAGVGLYAASLTRRSHGRSPG